MQSRSALAPRRAAVRKIRSFARDARGVSAIEFALILPAMVLLYFGLAEIVTAMMAERRAGHAASAVGDLVAQHRAQDIDKDLVDDIFYVGVGTMRPFPTADLSLRVTSVQSDEDNIPRVIWSRAHGPALAKLATDAEVTVPFGLLEIGDSVVMSEVSYSYETPFKHVIPNSIVFKDKFYFRPRRAAVIECPDCL
jgi:Flp pilus assembly protein TadG